MKKFARTSAAVGLFVVSIVAAFDYIHAETSALKANATAVQKKLLQPASDEDHDQSRFESRDEK